MKRIIPILIVLTVFTLSCTRTVYVPIERQAQVYTGPHIERVAIVNRSTPEESMLSDVTDVLTGNVFGINEEAAKKAIDVLYQNLNNNYRFEPIRVTDEYKTPELWGNWPPVMEWDKIEKICNKYDADAVIVLESFDSNFIVTDGTRNVRKNDESGRRLREFYVRGVATVKLGFRLYDPYRKDIADEYMFNHVKSWEKSGNAFQIVLGGLIDHRMAVVETGAASGSIYAERIIPHWIRANRQFFTKGRFNNDFKIGVRRATVNDWEGAMKAWHKSVKSPRRKTAGRSAYNLALMYEIKGDFQTARKWATKAYVDYGINKGRGYARTLQRRMN